jgi:hypothetical protein
MRAWFFGTLIPVSFIIAGCALNLDQLVPQSAISDFNNNYPGLIQICSSAGPNTPEVLRPHTVSAWRPSNQTLTM